MLRILGTIFAALLGLAFGSFLNVCLSRWPEGESVVHPRSHCRACERTLAWWENVPLVSWLALRGRCRTCGAWIGVRCVVVEAVIAASWAIEMWHSLPATTVSASLPMIIIWAEAANGIAHLIFIWLVVALAVLDFEQFWLPDFLTLSGIGLGLVSFLGFVWLRSEPFLEFYGALGIRSRMILHLGLHRALGILAAAAIILLVRWLYWLIRRREGLGLGDAKLMAMIAAWLGPQLALLSLFLGVVVGALFAVGVLVARSGHKQGSWAAARVPLGTFLCIGAIVSALCGQQIFSVYLRWAGF